MPMYMRCLLCRAVPKKYPASGAATLERASTARQCSATTPPSGTSGRPSSAQRWMPPVIVYAS